MLQHAVQVGLIDGELGPGVVDTRVVHPRHLSKSIQGLSRLDDDRRARQVAEILEGARVGGPAGADDGQVIAERLDLGEDVAREQDGAAGGMGLADHLLEDGHHERVEAGGGLVQQVEFDVGREGRDERDLLPVSLGVGAALLRRVELEPFDEVGAARWGRDRRAARPAGRSPRRR